MRARPDAGVRVFVVWEPILPTDVSPPTTFALRLASDGRVQQYWDPGHVLAKQMAADARPPQPEPDCCDQSGILWDLAAVYPKGALWTDRLPPATLFNGTVVDIKGEIAALIAQ